MNFDHENIPAPHRGRFFIIFCIVIGVHFSLFGVYYFIRSPEKSIKNTVPLTDAGNMKIPLTTNQYKNAGSRTISKPLVYSWVDKEGIKNFSNNPPPQEANEIQIQEAIVSNTHLLSETIAKRLDAYPAPSRSTYVVIDGNQVFVPVRIGFKGVEVQTMLLLDTGATTTMVHREIATRLNIRETTRAVSTVADGRTVPTDITTVDYIVVGSQKLRNPQILIIDYHNGQKNSAGLLGMNFIKNFQYKIDFKASTITWNP